MKCIWKFAGIILPLAIVVLLSACATPMALSLKESEAHYKPRNDNRTGYVYLYREAEFFGSGRGIYITANGRRIGGLNSGTYFVHEAEPGELVIAAENWLEGDSKNRRKIVVEPGKRFFIRGSLKWGFLDAQPYIEIVNEMEGEQAVQCLKYATLE